MSCHVVTFACNQLIVLGEVSQLVAIDRSSYRFPLIWRMRICRMRHPSMCCVCVSIYALSVPTQTAHRLHICRPHTVSSGSTQRTDQVVRSHTSSGPDPEGLAWSRACDGGLYESIKGKRTGILYPILYTLYPIPYTGV